LLVLDAARFPSPQNAPSILSSRSLPATAPDMSHHATLYYRVSVLDGAFFREDENSIPYRLVVILHSFRCQHRPGEGTMLAIADEPAGKSARVLPPRARSVRRRL